MRATRLGKAITALTRAVFVRRRSTTVDRPREQFGAAQGGGNTGHDAVERGGPSAGRPRRRPAPVIVTSPDGTRRPVEVAGGRVRESRDRGLSRARAADSIRSGPLADAVASAGGARQQPTRATAHHVLRHAMGAVLLMGGLGGAAATTWALVHPVAPLAWPAAVGGLALVLVVRGAAGRSWLARG